jgi:hypothetical protein
VPTAANDVYFDDQYTTQNCTCDVAINCNNLTVLGTYDGKLDFANSSYAHSVAGNATFDGVGEVDCGNAIITCSGDFDNKDQVTWTNDSSKWILDGTTKTLRGKNASFNDLTVSGTITFIGGDFYPANGGTVSLSGTLTIATTTPLAAFASVPAVLKRLLGTSLLHHPSPTTVHGQSRPAPSIEPLQYLEGHTEAKFCSGALSRALFSHWERVQPKR